MPASAPQPRSYKSGDERAHWRSRLVAEKALTEEAADDLDNTIKLEVAEAARFALESEDPAPESIFEDVYWEIDHQTEAGQSGRHFFGD